jgi:hypothetical protein
MLRMGSKYLDCGMDCVTTRRNGTENDTKSLSVNAWGNRY